MKKLILLLMLAISFSTYAQTQDVLKNKTYEMKIEDTTITCYKVIRKYTIPNDYRPVYIYVWAFVPVSAAETMNSYDLWPFSFDMKIQYWYGVKVKNRWVEVPMGNVKDSDWIDVNQYFHGER
jgi:hypothetical protein